MEFSLSSLIPAVPELFVLGMTCLALVIALFVPKEGIIYFTVQSTLVGAAILTLFQFGHAGSETFSGNFISDPLSSFLKLFIYLTSFFAFLYAKDHIKKQKIPFAEFYILGLFSILGMMVLVSSNNFLTLYLGLELLSLPLYAMVALQRKSRGATEAAIKYFVMGAIASGMLLYGLSLLYGVTKSLDYSTVAKLISVMPPDQHLLLTFSLVFVVVGLVFKFGAAPFHMWVPDVYQAASAPVALFISSAPKIATLGMAIRILVQTMPSLHFEWQQILIVVAILSMGLGNFIAIAQSNIKRMLAYSSIAHVGYMSLGLLAANNTGYSAAMFYIVIYAIMSMGAFGMIILLSKAGIEAEKIEDFRGLNARSPWFAFIMLLLMFSMAGVPPTVGFLAKLTVLEVLVDIHMEWLAALAIMFAIVGAYYYIRIVRLMYFEAPEDTSPIEGAKDLRVAISLNGLAMLGLGLFPGGVIHLCRMAFGV